MRPAVWRFGALMIAACGGGKPATSTIENHATAASLVGMYFCAIEDTSYAYPEFACAIRDIAGHLMAAKLRGSVRFRGEIAPRDSGFTFSGELYCPYGDCTQPLHGTFVRSGNTLHGSFTDSKLRVRMIAAPENAFGGASYGGDGYGDPFSPQTYGSETEGRNL